MTGRILIACEEEMRRILPTANDDPETAHASADEVLCRALRALGFTELVADYEKLTRWFA